MKKQATKEMKVSFKRDENLAGAWLQAQMGPAMGAQLFISN
jgi:hypothetical protein